MSGSQIGQTQRGLLTVPKQLQVYTRPSEPVQDVVAPRGEQEVLLRDSQGGGDTGQVDEQVVVTPLQVTEPVLLGQLASVALQVPEQLIERIAPPGHTAEQLDLSEGLPPCACAATTSMRLNAAMNRNSCFKTDSFR